MKNIPPPFHPNFNVESQANGLWLDAVWTPINIEIGGGAGGSPILSTDQSSTMEVLLNLYRQPTQGLCFLSFGS